MPRAHVILAAYNQLPFLRLALRGYLRQTTRDFHLTVADDGSSDGTGAHLEEIRPAFEALGVGFSHVWHEDEGFRKCRILNEAVRQGPDAALLIFSDGDCIPPARFVERHIEAHGPGSFHVAGAFRLSKDDAEGLTGEDVDAGRHEALRPAESWKDIKKKARQSRWGTRLGRRHRPKILGLNFALDRSLFQALNGFDERFVSWGIGEDTDLRDRAMRHRPKPAVRVLYTQNDVYHLWHPVFQGGDQRAKSRAYYRQKRPVRCEMGLVQS